MIEILNRWTRVVCFAFAGESLTGADLTHANLTGADGLPEAPVVPNLATAILARVEANPVALEMRSWHTCGTTHCVAGHAIDIAGRAGYAPEKAVGASVAGAMIWFRSTGSVPNFHADNESALEDLRQRAAAAQEVT